MDAVEWSTRKLEMPARLALAQEAFKRYKGACFWFMPDDFRVTKETLHIVIQGLRSDGNREAFLLAARLCQ